MLWFSSYVIVFEFSWKVKEKKNRRHYLLIDPRIYQVVFMSLDEPWSSCKPLKKKFAEWIPRIKTRSVVLTIRPMGRSQPIIYFKIKQFTKLPLHLVNKFLLLGSMQPRAVHPLPNAKDIYPLPYLLPGFWFSWSPSLGSSMIVAIFLFSSYRAVSSGKSSSILRRCPYNFNYLLWIIIRGCLVLLLIF